MLVGEKLICKKILCTESGTELNNFSVNKAYKIAKISTVYFFSSGDGLPYFKYYSIVDNYGRGYTFQDEDPSKPWFVWSYFYRKQELREQKLIKLKK